MPYAELKNSYFLFRTWLHNVAAVASLKRPVFFTNRYEEEEEEEKEEEKSWSKRGNTDQSGDLKDLVAKVARLGAASWW